MRKKLELNYERCIEYIEKNEILQNANKLQEIHNSLFCSNKKEDFLGWINLPNKYNKNKIDEIKEISLEIVNNSEILIVIGVGGSYMGSRAIIEALNHTYYNLTSENTPKIFFIGNNFSSKCILDLIDIVADKDFSINVISKSGNTLETLIAFNFFYDILLKKYGKENARKRIYITTDNYEGKLGSLAKKEKYTVLEIPKDVPGRFSVLTAAGLLPIAVSGINIEEIMQGALDAKNDYILCDINNNDCYKYAIIRHILYSKGKFLEIIGSYEPCMFYFQEWIKQLFAESQGKNNKGIFPATAIFSTDLHSIGQYIQEGLKITFETIINIEKPNKSLNLKDGIIDISSFNNKNLNLINKVAMEGAQISHYHAGIPNIRITIQELTPYYLGYLIYFFELSCAVGGYLLDVDTFTQNGVEEYKKNMIDLIESKN